MLHMATHVDYAVSRVSAGVGFFFVKQKTAYEMRISDWSSDVCSSDLHAGGLLAPWQEGTPARLLFPNAHFVVGAQHWQRAIAPHPRDRASFIPDRKSVV